MNYTQKRKDIIKILNLELLYHKNKLESIYKTLRDIEQKIINYSDNDSDNDSDEKKYNESDDEDEEPFNYNMCKRKLNINTNNSNKKCRVV
jgi:hypothetical protein